MNHRETRKPRLLTTPARALLRRRVLASLLIALLGAKAQAEPFGLELRDAEGGWQPGLALDTEVRMQIRGLMAEVVVVQRYQNASADFQEGRYLLPLPSDAAVGSLRIRIGERLIEGEVQEKQQAQQTYQQAVASGQQAALVEQNRPNLFRTAVANIAPGQPVTVEIGYWQPVSYRDGEFALSLPLTFTPPYLADGAVSEAPIAPPAPASAATAIGPTALEPSLSLSVDLVAGVALSRVFSPTHDIEVTSSGEGHQLRLARWVEQADRDVELRWTPAPKAEPQRALFAEQIGEDRYVQLLIVPPTEPVDPLPRELILVLDHSGSMYGSSMEQALAALDATLARLRPDDRFNLVRFNDHSERFADSSLPASPDNVARARAWVAGIHADGGTEMAPAISLAFSTPPVPGYLRQLVLITDAAIGNENALLGQIEHERGEARVFAVGIGSAPNEHFIRRAAELGRGSHELVRDISVVQPRMEALLNRLDRPLLSGIDVQWPGVAEAYPTRVPDLYAGEPLQLVARLADLDGLLKVGGMGRHAAWRDSLPLALGKQGNSRGIGRLWARAKLDALESDERAGVDPQQIRAASLEVALAHGLASRFTSLVAVDKTPTRPLDAALSSTAIANALPADSLAMAQGATSARSLLGSAIALLLLGSALLRRGRAG